MSLFHQHRWAIIAITATQPHPKAKWEGGLVMNASEIERFILGVTTFVLRCQDLGCQEVQMREALGQVTQLDVGLAPLQEIPR